MRESHAQCVRVGRSAKRLMRTERSFELNNFVKNYCNETKENRQRILPLTAIAIDSKLWGFLTQWEVRR